MAENQEGELTITSEEVRGIDLNQVDSMQLKDGTVVILQKEDELDENGEFNEEMQQDVDEENVCVDEQNENANQLRARPMMGVVGMPVGPRGVIGVPGPRHMAPVPIVPKPMLHHRVGVQYGGMGKPGNKLGPQVNQMVPPGGQFGPKTNQYGPKVNQFGPQVNQFGPKGNQMVPQVNQFGPKGNQMVPPVNQYGPKGNQFGPQVNQFGPKGNQFGPQVNQFGPKGNQFGPQVNQFGPKGNQMVPPVNQFGPKGNQVGPKTNQFGPKGNQLGPKGNQAVPKTNQLGPQGNQVVPKTNQLGPQGNQMPVPQQGMNQTQNPTPSQPAQIPNKPPTTNPAPSNLPQQTINDMLTYPGATQGTGGPLRARPQQQDYQEEEYLGDEYCECNDADAVDDGNQLRARPMLGRPMVHPPLARPVGVPVPKPVVPMMAPKRGPAPMMGYNTYQPRVFRARPKPVVAAVPMFTPVNTTFQPKVVGGYGFGPRGMRPVSHHHGRPPMVAAPVFRAKPRSNSYDAEENNLDSGLNDVECKGENTCVCSKCGKEF